MRPPPSSASASGEILPKVIVSFAFAFMALDSFHLLQVESCWLSSVTVRDGDRLDDPFRFRTDQIDRQQPVLQISPQHLHPFREHEGALELARRDAAVEILSFLLVLLAPANDELTFLQRDVELIARETGDRQRDPQAFGLPVLAGDPFDVVGRVAVRSLGDAVERTLDLVEPKKKGTGQRRYS